MKLKFKKTLIFAPIIAIGTITPLVSLGACGGNTATSHILALNKDLTQNWSATELESQVTKYVDSIKNNSSTQLVDKFKSLLNQLYQANSLAYVGFSGIATYKPLSPDPKDMTKPLEGCGMTFVNNNSIQDAYNFFATRTTDQIYPTWDVFQTFIPDFLKDSTSPLPEPIRNMFMIDLIEFPYAYLTEVYTYARIVKIAELLFKLPDFINLVKNDKEFATDLYTVYLNIKTFFGKYGQFDKTDSISIPSQPTDPVTPLDKPQPLMWQVPTITDEVNAFLTWYENDKLTISNVRLEQQAAFNLLFGIDILTGNVILTFHTTNTDATTVADKV